MIKEYPPVLSGTAENQCAQLRAFLVRLVRYDDERYEEILKMLQGQPADGDRGGN